MLSSSYGFKMLFNNITQHKKKVVIDNNTAIVIDCCIYDPRDALYIWEYCILVKPRI